jgi:O-antigen/teichoic acid export membrane protein
MVFPPGKASFVFFGKNSALSTGGLIAGSIVTSLINIAMLPIIARAYGPTAIGIGSSFISLHSFLLIVATGRYSLAIPLPKSEISAKYLILIVALLATSFGLFIVILGLHFGNQIGAILSMPEISVWIPWLGLMSAVAGLFEAVNYWLVRNKKFHTKSILNVSHTLFFLGCLTIGAFLADASIFNYMQAIVIGTVGAGFCLSVFVLINTSIPKLRWSRMVFVASYYRHLPKHLLTTGVINNASTISLPIVLAIFSGPVAVASYTLVAQVLGRPFSLVSSSIWQVVYGNLGNADNNTNFNTRELEGIYNFTSLLYCIPLIACVALADRAVYFLGDQWSGIGPIIGLYLIMAYFQFSSNSISYFQSFGKYSAESAANTTLIITRFGAIILAGSLGLDAYHTILIFCVSSAVVYLAITTYWSYVFNLGPRLPLRGIGFFAISYTLALLAKQYLEHWTLYLLLFFVLTAILIACIKYYRDRSFGHARA